MCDGEVVSWAGERLSFDLLQQRLAAGPARARVLAAEHPASYVVFDLLAANSVDLRGRRFDDRRAALEALTTWSPPMQLSPITDDFDTARSWLVDYAGAGIEGLVAKGASTVYRPGFRGWQKYNSVGVQALPALPCKWLTCAFRLRIVRGTCRAPGVMWFGCWSL